VRCMVGQEVAAVLFMLQPHQSHPLSTTPTQPHHTTPPTNPTPSRRRVRGGRHRPAPHGQGGGAEGVLLHAQGPRALHQHPADHPAVRGHQHQGGDHRVQGSGAAAGGEDGVRARGWWGGVRGWGGCMGRMCGLIWRSVQWLCPLLANTHCSEYKD